MLKWIVNFMITSMIFFPAKAHDETPADYGLISEDVYIQVEESVKIHGWYLKSPEQKGTILFFHGNAGNISHRIYKVKRWIELGFSVLMIDYREYGLSEGKIKNQEDLVKDAEATFAWLLSEKKADLSKLVLYGESLGTHPAIRLANQHKAGALILEAPFTSFVDLGKRHYPFVPSALINDFAFPNIDYIDKIQTPLFILHGTNDEICSYSMGQTLFEKAPSPKEFFTVDGGAHNDLPMSAGEDYWEKPYAFLRKHMSGISKTSE